MEKTVTQKDQIVDWLKRSAAAVKTAHLAAKPADLQRKVKIMGRDATVDGMYFTCAFLFTPMSTWGNWWPMPA